MVKKPDNRKKPGRTPKSKAHRPEVQPIGPDLAELLNPAINRGEAGVGSTTGVRSAREDTPNLESELRSPRTPQGGREKNWGLQGPPDNSWDRRAGGEAAAHRARASTRGKSDDVAKRDKAANPSAFSLPPPASEASGGEGSGVGGTF